MTDQQDRKEPRIPRDDIAEAHRARQQDEPAAAPLEADREAGQEGPVPRTEPADTYKVKASGDDSDVRAGPGDAGAQDAPRRLPETAPQKAGWQIGRPVWIGIGGGIIVALILLMLA